MSLKESQTGVFHMYTPTPGGILLPEDLLQNDINKQKVAKEAEEARAMFMELQEKKQKELDTKLETLELLPMLNKVILLPYPRNPYKKILNGKIIMDNSGSFKNPDSGEQDDLKELVGCAKVIEIGPEAKYLKAGDDVFYDTRTCYPVPFMSQGYLLTGESQILCVLNENLKQRFNMAIETS
ncbi:MAG: hypothetical protein ACOH2V_00260 [Candidatus Saccharimonadaceae bacterium]